jgi:putative peptidoglycan lipid II flippase
MLRSVLTVGGWTMASRILGFARDMLIAARLGTGPVADAFFVALRLPNLFRRLFGEGAFNAAFIPAFSGTLVTEGRASARDLAERLFCLMTLWLSGLAVLGILFMPQVIGLLAPGFGREPEKFVLAVEMTRIIFPYLVFICLAALVSGVLNGLDRFAAAAATPVLFNLLSMIALLALTPYVATPGHALAWGVVVSGIAQLALVWLAAAQAGMLLNPIRSPRPTPAMRLVLRRMLPGMLGAGVTQINLAMDTIIASFLASGSVSYLYYADRVGQLPLGVIGAAVGTALLPLLSRQLRGGQRLAAHRSTNRAIEMALLLTLPCAVGLAVTAEPIVAALFQRGAFGPDATAATAAALMAYAAGLPAFVLIKVAAPGFFARGDTTTPVRIGIAAVALNLGLNLALMGPLQHVGVALSTTLSAWFNLALLAILLARRGHLRLDRRCRRRLPRLLAASLAMGAAVTALQAAIPHPSDHRALIVVSLIAAGAAVFTAVAVALRAVEVREVVALLQRKGRGPGMGSAPPGPTPPGG